ncbi:MAG: hypothetical protein WDW36_000567 [Sanguina aurantia]
MEDRDLPYSDISPLAKPLARTSSNTNSPTMSSLLHQLRRSTSECESAAAVTQAANVYGTLEPFRLSPSAHQSPAALNSGGPKQGKPSPLQQHNEATEESGDVPTPRFAPAPGPTFSPVWSTPSTPPTVPSTSQAGGQRSAIARQAASSPTAASRHPAEVLEAQASLGSLGFVWPAASAEGTGEGSAAAAAAAAGSSLYSSAAELARGPSLALAPSEAAPICSPDSAADEAPDAAAPVGASESTAAQAGGASVVVPAPDAAPAARDLHPARGAAPIVTAAAAPSAPTAATAAAVAEPAPAPAPAPATAPACEAPVAPGPQAAGTACDSGAAAQASPVVGAASSATTATSAAAAAAVAALVTGGFPQQQQQQQPVAAQRQGGPPMLSRPSLRLNPHAAEFVLMPTPRGSMDVSSTGGGGGGALTSRHRVVQQQKQQQPGGQQDVHRDGSQTARGDQNHGRGRAGAQ